MTRLRKQLYSHLPIVFLLGTSLGIIFLILSNHLLRASQLEGLMLPTGEVLGGDFICFYLAGKIFAMDPSSLYDFSHMYSLQEDLIGQENLGSKFWPFVYPPLVAAAFSVFSSFSFEYAYYCWLILSTLLAGLALHLTLSQVELAWPRKVVLFVASFSFIPFTIYCLAGGQTACIALLIFAATFALLKQNQNFLAGLVLSLGYYKPPLFVGFLVFMLLRKNWRVLQGFAIGEFALIVATLFVTGWHGMLNYIQSGWSYYSGTSIIMSKSYPSDMGVGLLSLLSTLLGEAEYLKWPLYLLVSLLLISWTNSITSSTQTTKNSCRFDLTIGLYVGLSLFISPYVHRYDMTALLVSLLILAGHFRGLASLSIKTFGLLSIAVIYCEFSFPTMNIGTLEIKTMPIALLMIVVTNILALKQKVGTTQTLCPQESL